MILHERIFLPSRHFQALDKLFYFPYLHIAVGARLVRAISLWGHNAAEGLPPSCFWFSLRIDTMNNFIQDCNNSLKLFLITLQIIHHWRYYTILYHTVKWLQLFLVSPYYTMDKFCVLRLCWSLGRIESCWFLPIMPGRESLTWNTEIDCFPA